MTWKYRNREYTMEHTTMYGHYLLNGYLCTNAFIYDYATDDSDEKLMKQARKEAEAFVTSRKKLFKLFLLKLI